MEAQREQRLYSAAFRHTGIGLRSKVGAARLKSRHLLVIERADYVEPCEKLEVLKSHRIGRIAHRKLTKQATCEILFPATKSGEPLGLRVHKERH